MIDWHKILVAYISHVNACEGADFIEWYGAGGTAIETLTDAEREAWTLAGKEAREFDKRKKVDPTAKLFPGKAGR